MPLFEYRCADCGTEFEELGSAQDTPVCPSCHSANTKRLMSACRHCCGGSGNGDFSMPSAPSGGGCAGCSGGNCASCH